MIKPPLNLIILGPQGSGKGTQAELLAEKFNLVFLGAGNLLREIAKTDTLMGREVQQIINVEGRHVRSEIITKLFKDKLASIPKNQGLIIEGYPRGLEQYHQFKEYWAKFGRGDYRVLFLELSEDKAVKRLSTRLTCETCGKVYVAGEVRECITCGGRLTRREDDKPEVIKKRLESFRERTIPMVNEMENEGKVIRVNGARPIEEVHKEVLRKLNLK